MAIHKTGPPINFIRFHTIPMHLSHLSFFFSLFRKVFLLDLVQTVKPHKTTISPPLVSKRSISFLVTIITKQFLMEISLHHNKIQYLDLLFLMGLKTRADPDNEIHKSQLKRVRQKFCRYNNSNFLFFFNGFNTLLF